MSRWIATSATGSSPSRSAHGPAPGGADSAPSARSRDHIAPRRRPIQAEAAAGRPVIPEIAYRDIAAATSPTRRRAAIRKTGCAVVRGVYPESVATGWFEEVGDYLDDNRYEEKEIEKRSLDKYFSALKAGKPQIFNVYWSKPQVNARQGESLAVTRSFLDRLWTVRGRLRPRPAVRLCRSRPPPPARRHDPRPVAAHGCRHRRALDRSRLPARLRARLRGRLARLRPFDGTHRLETERDPVAGGRQRLPHLPGLDRAHPPGAERRHAAPDPDRRGHLLRASPRAAGRRGRGRSLRRRAGPGARRQPAMARRI